VIVRGEEEEGQKYLECGSLMGFRAESKDVSSMAYYQSRMPSFHRPWRSFCSCPCGSVSHGSAYRSRIEGERKKGKRKKETEKREMEKKETKTH